MRTLPEPDFSFAPMVINGLPTCSTAPTTPVQGGDATGIRAGQVDARLGGLDGHDDLVNLHLVALGDVPLHHLGLGQALTQVGQHERAGGGIGEAHAPPPVMAGASPLTNRASGWSSHCSRAIASRTRSTPGRWNCSSLGGG